MSHRSPVQELPLHGRRIVVTRPPEDAERLAERLRSLGAHAIIAPVIRAEFHDPPPPELVAALAQLNEYDWIVFTSKNGVEAVFRLVASITGPRIAAIGPATAAALGEHGVEPDLIPDEFVAEAVVAALGDVSGQHILLPRADIARPVLADELCTRGARITQVAAYKTVMLEVDPALWNDADTVTFTSSSTVRGLLASGPIPAGVNVVCIGPVTAATARECGLRVSAVADTYTVDGLVEALLATAANPHPTVT